MKQQYTGVKITGGIFAILLGFALQSMAQAPQVQWAKCFGGSLADKGYDAHQTGDGGFILCGSAASPDGDLTGNKGGLDAWIVKTDSLGNIDWQRNYGGSADDWFKSIRPLGSGGYLAAGSTASADGDVSVNKGAFDLWIVRLDSAGNILWEKTFGGSENEGANDLASSADTGFVAVGYTFSSDGDISEYKGDGDAWMVFTDLAGTFLKQKTKGGSNYDEFVSAAITANGGFIVSGFTFSNTGTVSGNHGGSDAWIIRLSKQGNEQWNILFGDSLNDKAVDAKENADGNFTAAGILDNGDGGETWIFTINEAGIVTQATHGGDGIDGGGPILETAPASYTVAANSFSAAAGEKDCSLGSDDIWLINETSGSLSWQTCLGGTLEDAASASISLPNAVLVLAGFTNSQDGNVTGNHGDYDFWLVKLASGCAVSASFEADNNSGAVTFTNTSLDATSYFWIFGDGNTSDEANPVHNYADTGTYEVCLIASSFCSADTACQTIEVSCQTASAAFIATPDFTLVSFTATDTNATSWEWNFGDGTVSTDQNPVHDYVKDTTYQVCLIASNFCSADTLCQEITLLCAPIEASFTFLVDENTVTFTSTSAGAESWKWKFGDTGNSNDEHPVHTYADTGTYEVCLIISNGCSEDTACMNVKIGCDLVQSGFEYTVDQFSVTFNDLSTFATSWSWDFGDGNTSDNQEPTHTYAEAGLYSVCLTTTNECSESTFCIDIIIECPLLNPGFTYSQDEFTVSFTDLSADADTWNWDFGDGNVSTDQNPVHTYATSGLYQVCLVVTNECSTDTICEATEVVCPEVTGAFDYSVNEQTVTLNDLSSGATSWSWDLGDGSTATSQNLEYTYTTGGTYLVCLFVSNGCNTDTTCIEIEVECPFFAADFVFIQDNDTVSFTDESLNSVSWSWEFGDGGVSTDPDPTHVYLANGIYTVCLTAGDGCSFSTFCDTVVVIGLSASIQNEAVSMGAYPNPFISTTTIAFELPAAGLVQLELLDQQGREVATLWNASLMPGKHEIPVYRGNLSPGIYLVRFITGSGTSILKVILE